MAIKLTVTEPFGDYARGDQITEPAAVQSVLDGENSGHVVSVQAPDAPAKAAKAAD